MAYDETLATRIRALLAHRPRVAERLMFGGLAFMVDGHMACGVVGERLMLRIGAAAADDALQTPHVRPMDFTGRPMTTMVFIEPAGASDPDDLSGWLALALTHVATLPRRP